jgi:glycosyltransferase involved in cell wall biosynthesis
MRVVHMTSVHPWHDTRIFVKMCCSLAAGGHEVHLVVPRRDGSAVERRDGVTIHAVPQAANRVQRMMRIVPAILRYAAGLAADLYHFHDPEFLPRSKAFQKRVERPVVYDVHEDVRLQVLSKQWIPAWGRGVAGRAAGWFEDHVAWQLAGVVAATPWIARRFESHPRCVVVQNFPLIDELAPDSTVAEQRQRGLFAYVGGIAEIRGAREMVASLPEAGPQAILSLAGLWEDESLRADCARLPGWRHVQEYGYLDRPHVRILLQSAQAGLVVLHPTGNYVTAYPVKLFEYMAAGLPVIASDFPLWRSIIDGAGCGLLVDPRDPKAIAGAMRWIIDHPDEARAMGERGHRAVVEKYNWEREFPRLLALYQTLGT